MDASKKSTGINAKRKNNQLCQVKARECVTLHIRNLGNKSSRIRKKELDSFITVRFSEVPQFSKNIIGYIETLGIPEKME